MNEKAFSFKLPDQDGKIHSLNDYKGKIVLLYFYPKDMTPGCTTEAQCFRDRLNDFEKLGVQVLGVSADSVESHKRFADKHNLNFPLLSDEKKESLDAYKVWKKKSMFGKTFLGIKRSSFLINQKGEIVKHYAKVSPSQHPEEVLKDIKELGL